MPIWKWRFFSKVVLIGGGKDLRSQLLNLLNNFAWVSTNFWNTFSRPGRLVVVFTICKVSNIYHSRSLTINCWTSWRRWKNRWFVHGNNGFGRGCGRPIAGRAGRSAAGRTQETNQLYNQRLQCNQNEPESGMDLSQMPKGGTFRKKGEPDIFKAKLSFFKILPAKKCNF